MKALAVIVLICLLVMVLGGFTLSIQPTTCGAGCRTITISLAKIAP